METPIVTDDRGASGTSGTEDEIFDKAFNEAQGVKDAADQVPPAAEVPEKPEGGENPTPLEPPTGGQGSAEQTPPPEVDELKKAEQRYSTLQGIHKKDREDFEAQKKTFAETEANLRKEIEELKKGSPKEPPPKVEPTAADGLTEDQLQAIADYKRDYDVVSQMEGLQREKGLKDLETRLTGILKSVQDEFSNRLSAIDEEVKKKVAPAEKLVTEMEEQRHFQMIQEGYALPDGTMVEGHPDFMKYRGEEDGGDGSLLKWIEGGPRYLQEARKRVYEKGTAVELIELLTEFKTNMNIRPEPPRSNAKREQKRQALSAVQTRSSAVSSGKASGSDDFEGAFEEAVKSAGGL